MKKMNLSEFKKKVYLKYNGDISVIGSEYINNKHPIKVVCNVCGTIRFAIPNKLLTDSKCSICSKKKKKNPVEFREEVEKITNGEYIVLTDYENVSKKVKMLHTKCGNEWNVSPSNFLHVGTRCPECSHPSKRKSTIKFKKDIKNLFKNEFKVVSKYVNNHTNITIQHSICGSKFKKRPNCILNKKVLNCPTCHAQKSFGVRQIERFLNKNEIPYKTEKRIKKCVSDLGIPLKYDFYLKEFKLFIEFDGEQHFVAWYKNPKSLKRTRDLDLMKNQWVLNNSKFSLLRIKYTSKNKIRKILKKILLEKGSTTIEKHNIYYIKNSVIINNKNYYAE